MNNKDERDIVVCFNSVIYLKIEIAASQHGTGKIDTLYFTYI